MIPLSPEEENLASELVAEFAGTVPGEQVHAAPCIYRSHAFPESRLVLKVQTTTQCYALKIDTLSPETGRLNKEFEVLSQLHVQSATIRATQVVRPVYLSPGAKFLVTDFVDRPTAADFIHNSADDVQVAQIYRRAGAWLSDLHGTKASTDYAFRPKWMTELVEELCRSAPDQIARLARPMVQQVVTEASHLKGRPQPRVFAHGDFHPLNLIIGKGQAIGLDFTEAETKLSVYDMVDFLKADIFRDGPNGQIDKSGVLSRNKDMFLRQYKHPLDTEVLDFCLRARLLIDWLRLNQPDHNCSAYENGMRTRLEARLRKVFIA